MAKKNAPFKFDDLLLKLVPYCPIVFETSVNDLQMQYNVSDREYSRIVLRRKPCKNNRNPTRIQRTTSPGHSCQGSQTTPSAIVHDKDVARTEWDTDQRDLHVLKQRSFLMFLAHAMQPGPGQSEQSETERKKERKRDGNVYLRLRS